MLMMIIVKQLIGQRKQGGTDITTGHALLHLEKKRHIVYKEERERERDEMKHYKRKKTSNKKNNGKRN